jgi:UDP-glucose 4-epimerase
MSAALVTGATTPLGRRVVEHLANDASFDHVLAVGGEPATSPTGTECRIVYRQVDLTRRRDLHDLLFGVARELGVSVVVHLALHRDARDEGPSIRALNVEATRELLHQCERLPELDRFVLKSSSGVYRIDPRRSALLTEEDPLELSPSAPQSVRDRVEADLSVCTRIGSSRLAIAVLRCAEILASGVGSQLYDYLSSRLCFRPIGFDPMLNVLSLEDATRALAGAVSSSATGVFNVPGADTLPLSLAIELSGRFGIPVPGPLLAPLYRVRASALGMEFRYDVNHRRFHFSAVLDGTRAERDLGFGPEVRVHWPDLASPLQSMTSRAALKMST